MKKLNAQLRPGLLTGDEVRKGEIYTITCRCGEKFSSSEYYKDHLADVRHAMRMLKAPHGRKQVERLEKRVK